MNQEQKLGKEIKARQYFSLAFGCIIGVGWIILMGNWLEQAGPLGAMLAFAIGGFMMMMVGACYAEVATLLPAAGGEVVFAYEIAGSKTSFGIGWVLALLFIATNVFEAISTGWLLSILIPASKGQALYRIGGESINLGTLSIGLGGMILLTILSYRGLKSAAIFQEVFTYGLIIFAVIFMIAGIAFGKAGHLMPLFSKSGTGPVLGGITAVFIIVPFMMSGFDVIPQTIEEKSEKTSLRKVGAVIILSVSAATVFYILCILATSMAGPWKNIVSMEMPAAGAFEAAFNSPLLAQIVLYAGLCGIITTWNTCFIAAVHAMFALGRARIIPPVFGRVHPRFRSPFISVLFVGLVGCLGVFLGRSFVVPIANVAGTLTAFAYGSTCVVLIILRKRRPDEHRPYRVPGGIGTAVFSILSCLLMLFLGLYQPYVDAKGAFPREWAIMLLWLILGVLFWIFAKRYRSQISEAERYRLIQGK